ncbi:MAG: hypothetical protein IJL60_10120, partial [Clostridiales bacterium]|nr:hypothetical protein [Clostridiales bacterium]
DVCSLSAPFWSDSQGTLSTNYWICKTKPSVCKTKNKEKIQFKNTIFESNPSGAVRLIGQHFLYHVVTI